jgi:hypothetical protein
MLRTTNVLGLVLISALILAFWKAHRARRQLVMALGLGTALGVLIQLIYNRYASGYWTLSSYGAESFLWHRPMAISVLLSFERGLVTYYPFFGLALCLGLMSKRTRIFGLGAAILTLMYATLYGFWHSWYLGGGFGHRGFVEWVPGVILLGGLALQGVPARRLVLAASAVLVSAGVGLVLLSGYWSGTLDFAGTTEQVYLQQFTLTRSAIVALALGAVGYLTLRRLKTTALSKGR